MLMRKLFAGCCSLIVGLALVSGCTPPPGETPKDSVPVEKAPPTTEKAPKPVAEKKAEAPAEEKKAEAKADEKGEEKTEQKADEKK